MRSRSREISTGSPSFRPWRFTHAAGRDTKFDPPSRWRFLVAIHSMSILRREHLNRYLNRCFHPISLSICIIYIPIRYISRYGVLLYMSKARQERRDMKDKSPGTGRRPGSMTKGFLTDKRREFLKLEPEARKEEFGENNARQYRNQIKERARQAVKDLALVASGLSEEDIRDIFDPDVMDYLLYFTVSKIGREVSTMGPFYQILLNSIRVGMDADASERKEWMNIQVTMSSAKFSYGEELGISNPDRGDMTHFFKMVEPE